MRGLPPGGWPKATHADWRAQAQADLDGADPDALRFELDDGVVIEPLFGAEPLAALEAPPRTHGSPPPPAPPASTSRAAPPAPCRIACALEVTADDPSAAIGDLLATGFDTVRLGGATLAARIGGGDTGWLRTLAPEHVVLTLPLCATGVHLLAALERDGLPHQVVPDLAADLDDLPPSIELAYMLAASADLIRGCGQPHPPRSAAVLRRLCIPICVGTDLLTQLAKLRAARWIWHTMAHAVQTEVPAPTRLWATASRALVSAIDPHLNLVRTSLQTFVALAGNADHFEPLPFDLAKPAEAQRLALNQVRLLRHEAGLEQVAEPAAGAHAVEALTRDIAHRAWSRFQAIEAAGGFTAAAAQRDEILGVGPARRTRAARIRSGDDVVVGVNRFADPRAAISEFDPADPRCRTEEFAALRRRTARGPRRVALLLPFGDAGARRAAAEFAAEFLRVAGLEVAEAPGGADPQAFAELTRAQRPALAVLCGDVATQATMVREAAAAIASAAPAALIYATGQAPPGSQHWGPVGFLHASLDRAATLAGILDRLDGIR